MKDQRVFLEGERVYLRPLAATDVEGAYPSWFDDDEVCRGNSHHRFPKSKPSFYDFVESQADSRSDLVLAVISKETTSHIGNISLQGIDYIARSAEFAIIMGDKTCWGKGLSTEAGKLIVDHGFRALNLNRIYCGTYEHNHGMRGLARTLGFVQEGIRRQADYKDGKYVDVYEFGLLREEWLKIGAN